MDIPWTFLFLRFDSEAAAWALLNAAHDFVDFVVPWSFDDIDQGSR
jgi:hypothetical protein